MIRFFTPERRKTAGHWLAELVIVVAGVLIALYAQQWDSDRKSKKRGAEAEERIRVEIASNARVQLERLAIHACLRDRLKTIADKIRHGDNNWDALVFQPDGTSLWTFPRIYRAPSRNYGSDAFQGAVSSGAIEVMEPGRQVGLGGMYRQYAKAAEINREEYAFAAQLDALTLGEPLDPAEKQRILATVALLDRYNGLSALIARQSLTNMKSLGFWPTPKELLSWMKYVNGNDTRRGGTTIARERETYGNCVDPSGFDIEKQARPL